ncbi:MAG: YdeI/OmpD-associated family protein [Agriterribacter sp.]
MQKDEIEVFSPKSRQEWRRWLKANHATQQSVWLLLYRLDSGKPTIDWTTAVEEALCFGWIDSKRKPLDKEKFIQFFSKRKPNGTWSRINKEKVQQLIDNGRMSKAGLITIEAAKQNGSWNILDNVEAYTIPKDLSTAFRKHAGSRNFFLSLSKSVQKRLLQWIVLARRPETRQKRINEIAELAAQGIKPKQF